MQLHPVNTIMKSFMALILDQILFLLFIEKNLLDLLCLHGTGSKIISIPFSL